MPDLYAQGCSDDSFVLTWGPWHYSVTNAHGARLAGSVRPSVCGAASAPPGHGRDARRGIGIAATQPSPLRCKPRPQPQGFGAGGRGPPGWELLWSSWCISPLCRALPSQHFFTELNNNNKKYIIFSSSHRLRVSCMLHFNLCRIKPSFMLSFSNLDMSMILICCLKKWIYLFIPPPFPIH